MIQTRSHIITFQGVLVVLSIVGSLFAFQNFATPADERTESVKTEWVASGKITRRTVAYKATACGPASPIPPVDHRFAELNHSRLIKTRIASLVPVPRIPRNFMPTKTVAGCMEKPSRSPWDNPSLPV